LYKKGKIFFLWWSLRLVERMEFMKFYTVLKTGKVWRDGLQSKMGKCCSINVLLSNNQNKIANLVLHWHIKGKISPYRSKD